jgi:hypothetical protein
MHAVGAVQQVEGVVTVRGGIAERHIATEENVGRLGDGVAADCSEAKRAVKSDL